MQPQTKYAQCGDLYIAYQVFGSGAIDLVLVPGFTSHLEHIWEDPEYTRFLAQLGRFSRVILFDKRGTGMSDRDANAPTLEERMEDVLAVMEAAGSKKAAIFGVSEGGPLAIMFAATYPEKTSALVLYGSWAKGSHSEDYPWALTKTQYEKWIREIPVTWGDPMTLSHWAPSAITDPIKTQWWGKWLRLGASPNAAINLVKLYIEIDVRPILPSIQVPALIIHRKEDRVVRVGAGRYLGKHIPGAKYVELEGADHLWWINENGQITAEIEEFLTGVRPSIVSDRLLTTVLFTDIVESTLKAIELGDKKWRDLLEKHNTLLRHWIQQFRGKEIKNTGDGFLAIFDGPSRAIRCAFTISERVKELGLETRVGLHTGECQLIGEDIGGVAVHMAARIMSLAKANEVIVSSTVKDLIAGSGVELQDQGNHTLKGFSEQWQLFKVVGI